MAQTQARQSLYGLRGSDLFQTLAMPVPVSTPAAPTAAAAPATYLPEQAPLTVPIGGGGGNPALMAQGFANLGDLMTAMNSGLGSNFELLGEQMAALQQAAAIDIPPLTINQAPVTIGSSIADLLPMLSAMNFVSAPQVPAFHMPAMPALPARTPTAESQLWRKIQNNPAHAGWTNKQIADQYNAQLRVHGDARAALGKHYRP